MTAHNTSIETESLPITPDGIEATTVADDDRRVGE